MNNIETINFANVGEKYQYILLDVWGVLINTDKKFSSANNILNQLKSHGASICLLSNTTMNNETLSIMLEQYNIDPNGYDDIVTAGDVAKKNIIDNCLQEIKTEYYQYFHIGSNRYANFLADSGYRLSNNINNVDFVLITDFDEEFSIEDYKQLIEKSHQRNLLFLCINPDTQVYSYEGSVKIQAGMLAKHYQDKGGKVSYFGKPSPAIYQHALSVIGCNNLRQAIMLGDNLDTDIVGANNANLDSALVISHINENFLEKLAENNIKPYKVNYIIEHLDKISNIDKF